MIPIYQAGFLLSILTKITTRFERTPYITVLYSLAEVQASHYVGRAFLGYAPASGGYREYVTLTFFGLEMPLFLATCVADVRLAIRT